jgi:transcriptional regulator with XRE-family HTH domain
VPNFGTSQKQVRRMLVKALKAAIPTQPELARAAGITYSALRQYRKGQRTPKPDVLRRLARALRQQGGKLAKLAKQLDDAAGQL